MFLEFRIRFSNSEKLFVGLTEVPVIQKTKLNYSDFEKSYEIVQHKQMTLAMNLESSVIELGSAPDISIIASNLEKERVQRVFVELKRYVQMKAKLTKHKQK